MPWLVAMGNDTSSELLNAALAAVRRRGEEMLALTRTWVLVNSYTANVAGKSRNELTAADMTSFHFIDSFLCLNRIAHEEPIKRTEEHPDNPDRGIPI